MSRGGALALALAAGLFLHGQPAGLGVTLVALGLLALAARGSRDESPAEPTAGGRRSGRTAGGRRAWWCGARHHWWALAAAFALVPVLRAAGWVQAIGIGGTVAFAMLAAGGFATLGQAFAAVGGMAGRWGRALPAARGVALAVALVVPFGALFATADAAFAEWVESAGQAMPDVDETLAERGLIAAAVLAVAGALLAVGPPREGDAARGRIGRTEWLIALGALNALFLSFVWLQVATLFGGHEYVRRTARLTYSEYVHQGFWQLVAVAALTLAVIAAVRRWTLREGDRDERLQRLLLGGLCALTLVVLVSAYSRLDLYVEAYGMTRLRVLVQWAILFLGGLFAIVLLAHRSSRLPRAAVAFTGVAVLALALTNPEGRIATHNLERAERTGKLDRALLRTLSPDAARAVGCRTEPLGEAGLAGFNVARHRARDLPHCG